MHYDHYGLILPNHKFRLKWQPTISVAKFIQSSEASFNGNGLTQQSRVGINANSY